MIVEEFGGREVRCVDVWGMEVRFGWRDFGIVCGPSTLTSPLYCLLDGRENKTSLFWRLVNCLVTSDLTLRRMKNIRLSNDDTRIVL